MMLQSVVVCDENRAAVLQTMLRARTEKKMIVVVSSSDSVAFHSELLSVNGIQTMKLEVLSGLFF